MKNTITCGPQVADHTDLSGSHFQDVNLSQSSFHDVNLSQSSFDDINLGNTTFHNVNFSDITITAAQIGGAAFKHIGLPPGSADKQRPIKFEECDFNHITIRSCDLSNAEISGCELSGMRINDVLVTDLFKAYNNLTKRQ
jgi:uncharacterized protein YjbI with pentapeptide repeats